jgi:hypothetical protein
MKWLMLGLLFPLGAFAAGWWPSASEAFSAVAVPAACPKFECKTIHAHWDGIGNTVMAIFNAGLTTNSDNAQQSLFTANSVEKNPLANSGNYDLWYFPACSPMCGKDAGGSWQAKQEVARAGVGTKSKVVLEVQRQACTATGGTPGPQDTNQNNDNTGGNSPPVDPPPVN